MKTKITKFLLMGTLLLLLIPQTVQGASDTSITYEMPETAKKGDTVSVKIELAGSTALTTLGLRLNYDNQKLNYEGEQWADEVKKSDSIMTLVSDVERADGKALNISMISDVGYQGKGAMVTLEFSAKADCTTMPFELELRDATDKDMKNVTSTIKIVSKNGNKKPDTPKPENPKPENSKPEQNEHPKPQKKPDTYQTGVEDFSTRLFYGAGIMGIMGVLCVLVMRKLSK